jgi:phospholipid transport system substrate-binding protein
MLAHIVVPLLLAATTGGPLQVVKQGNAEVQQLLKAPGVTVEKLAGKVDDFVDFAELAKRALGKDWDKLSKKQQVEFASTMKGLLRASYAQKALGQGEALTRYDGEKITDSEAEVRTVLQVKKDEFPVMYRLYKGPAKKAHWRIYDVVTDDVSLLETYRAQFRKVIADKGYDGLLAALKAKKEQLEKTPAPTAASN